MPIQVDADITHADFRARGRAVYARARRIPPQNGSFRGYTYLLRAFWVFIAVEFLLLYRLGGHGAVLGVLLFCTLGATFLFFVKRAEIEIQPEAVGVILGANRTVLSDAGIEQSTVHLSSVTAWPAVIAMEETDELLLFVLDRNVALMVTKRSFASEDQLREFRDFAARHVAANSRRVVASGQASSEE